MWRSSARSKRCSTERAHGPYTSLRDLWYSIGYHSGARQCVAMGVTVDTTTLEQRIATTLRESRARAGLSLRELAKRAGTSHSTLLAYEQAKKVPTTTTFFRVIEACGNVVDLDIQPRVTEHDGIPRGEELAAVLHLAAQFPHRASRHLDLPRFGERG